MADNPVTRTALVSRVAELYGFDSSTDTELATVALNLLDETVKEMNSHLYEFNKIVTSNQTMVANTQTVTLSSVTPVIYKESLAYLVRTTDSTKTDMLDYVVWEDFQRMYGSDTSTGVPVLYSFRNEALTVVVSLWPTPDTGTASAYALVLEYYRRIPLISSVAAGSSIDVPAEVETALMYGAQKRMAIHLKGASHPDVSALQALEEHALGKLQRIDRAHPDANRRFRVFGWHSTNQPIHSRNVVYLRIK